MQEMRPVEFKDGVLWLEEVPGDYTEDCLEFSHKSTVILRDAQQYILIVQNEVAYFKDMNKSQLNEGVQFDLIFYEPTECNRDCKFDNGLPTVSFVIQVNSKKYQMSCSKAKTIEFLEMKTSEEDMVDGDQCNLVFYKRRINQYSCFESALAQNHYLCTVSEKGLFKLGLKEFISQTDETIQIYVEV
ncbi:interleukin-18-like isoform X2 [Mobula birostris]|uniref:interleukin-18-like isoform X2 n=1 Tax=Mobula birostris TaxID=1983395 RepID=UPI003B28CA34